MSYGPVCARLLWGLVVVGSVWCMLRFLYVLDEDMREYKWSTWCALGTGLALAGSVYLYPGDNRSVMVCLGFLLINLYLVVSTTMDIMCKQVTDLVHYLGLAGGGILVFQAPPQPEVCKELIVYIMVQYCVFQRMYGRADVIGFVLCALFLATTGRGIGTYIGHMSLAFGLLALVQAFRQNIASNGNLKQPVALFPYIMCGFFLII